MNRTKFAGILIMYFGLVVIVCSLFVGCARPMSRDISARIKDDKLIIMYQSPPNEVWYNAKAGFLTFNEKETKYLKNILKDIQ